MKLIERKHPMTGETMKFFIRPGASDVKGIDEIFLKKAYQRPKMGFIPQAHEVWLDAGGNVGACAVYLSPVVKEVYCYECEPGNLKMIRQNLKLNGVKNVHLIPKAIVPDSHEFDTVRMWVNEDPNLYWRHSLVKFKRRKVRPISVEVEKISDALIGVHCAKIDIEGAEIPILKETKTWGLEKLVFEWSFDVDKRIATLRSVLKTLSENFDVVKHTKLPDQENWTFFPAATNVFCMNLKSDG